MGHPCGYFLGTSFSQIRNVNREFETKSFRGTDIYHLSKLRGRTRANNLSIEPNRMFTFAR